MKTFYATVPGVESELQSQIFHAKINLDFIKQREEEKYLVARCVSKAASLDSVAFACADHLKTIARKHIAIERVCVHAKTLMQSKTLMGAFAEYCKSTNPSFSIDIRINFDTENLQFITRYNITRLKIENVVFLPKLNISNSMLKNHITFKDLANED